VNFRVITQAADNSSGTYFMNFENAPSGSDYDNDEKGYLAYVVSGNSIKVIVYQSGSSAGATQKMGYIIDGVTDAGTYYTVSNNDLVANTQQGGGTWTTVLPSTIDAACHTAGFATSVATVANEECFYAQTGSAAPASKAYNRGVKTHTAGGSTAGQLQSPLWYAAKYGGFKDIDNDGKPSTTAEWDANGDGIPDNYFFVTNPALLETQLSNAFNAILAHAGSASSASVNSGSISSDTRVFQAKFDTSSWSGQLLAFAILSDGSIVTTPSWDASTKIPATRQILTVGSAGTGVPFKWTNLNATQKGQLHPSDSAAIGQLRLNYLRGDQSQELSQGGAFRNRDSPLGDIVNSAPVYVAKPPFRYSDSLETAPYSAFRTANAARTPTVYVGANDGMLHAFDASTNSTLPDPPIAGTEKFAFIPSAVFPNLYQLSSPNYSHLYYDDGTPSVVDAFYAGGWHTVLASGLNKGGREVFALDVTNPDLVTETNAASKVLWEFTSTTDPDLGYTFSRPAIVRMHNGKWAAVFGNGYNGTNTGHAILFVVDIQTGALVAKIDTKQGTATTPNGLATPAAVDLDGDGVVDFVYAGDLLGNMWKFDVRSTTASSWSVAYGGTTPVPLFTAVDANGHPQPITTRPQVGFGPGGAGVVVLFGTGKFIEASDRVVDTANPRPQSFYGIFDPNAGAIGDVITPMQGRSVLQEQDIVAEQAVVVPTIDSSGNTVNVTDNIRVTSQHVVDTTTKRGWFIDLQSPVNGYEGEKQVSDSILRNGKIIFTTTIADPDPCAFGGRSWLMEMDSLTGAQLQYSPFDLNNDKNFNDTDFVTVILNGVATKVPVSGLQSTNGLLTKPGIVSSTNAEYAISPDTSGTLEEHRQNPGPGALGRQSWRQLR
jgi:type IV pilus assembly protein PilY1